MRTLPALAVALLAALAGCTLPAPPIAHEEPRAPTQGAGASRPREPPDLVAELAAGDGRASGLAWASPGRSGVLVTLVAVGLEAGEHGVAAREGASCNEPGSHLNPWGAGHGLHAGDFPNLVADAEGRGAMAAFVVTLTTEASGPASLNGRVVTVHARGDDGETEPDGGAGAIALCGTLRAVEDRDLARLARVEASAALGSVDASGASGAVSFLAHAGEPFAVVVASGLSPGAHAMNVDLSGTCDPPTVDPAATLHLHAPGTHAPLFPDLDAGPDGRAALAFPLAPATSEAGAPLTTLARPFVVHAREAREDDAPAHGAGPAVLCGIPERVARHVLAADLLDPADPHGDAWGVAVLTQLPGRDAAFEAFARGLAPGGALVTVSSTCNASGEPLLTLRADEAGVGYAATLIEDSLARNASVRVGPLCGALREATASSLSGTLGPLGDALLEPMGGAEAAGLATARTFEGRLVLAVFARGVSPGLHGVAVHETGPCRPGVDGTAEERRTGGPHFDSAGAEHPRHAGDLGNLVADAQGRGVLLVATRALSLTGPATIEGKPVIVHSSPDDGATRPDGRMGGRVLCGALDVGG